MKIVSKQKKYHHKKHNQGFMNERKEDARTKSKCTATYQMDLQNKREDIFFTPNQTTFKTSQPIKE